MKRTLLAAVLAALTAPAAYAVDYTTALRSYLTDNIQPWAEDAVLVSAIIDQNARHAGLDAVAIDQLDKSWRAEVGAAATPTIDQVLTNAAADFLRARVAEAGGVVTEVFIMDNKGLNVASSGVTSDYWQGDEAKFQQTFSVGADAIHYSEIEFDESSQTYQAQISIALTDPATGAVIGAMTVGVVADALM